MLLPMKAMGLRKRRDGVKMILRRAIYQVIKPKMLDAADASSAEHLLGS
jgi:hypothetical protein